MASVDPRYDRAFQRGYLEPAEVDEAVDAPASARGRNPWLVVLWSLAAAFIAAGVWATAQAEVTLATPNADNSVTYYVLPYVLQALAPWVLAAGLGALVSAVVIHAVRWR